MFSRSSRKARLRRARRDRTSLGSILKDLGYCSEADLNAVLDTPSDLQLGRQLFEAGAVTTEQLEHALMRQRVLRGELDPGELKRYGTGHRRKAVAEVTDRLQHIAESAGLLASKVRG